MSDDDVPDLTGRRARARVRLAALYLAVSAGAALLGAVPMSVIGFLLWAYLVPTHGGCGQVGCWDALIGGMIGAAVGAVAMIIVAVLMLRRRLRHRPDDKPNNEIDRR